MKMNKYEKSVNSMDTGTPTRDEAAIYCRRYQPTEMPWKMTNEVNGNNEKEWERMAISV